MQLARQAGAIALAGILVAGCGLVPLAEGPSASPVGDSPPPAAPSASPEATAAASLAAPQTAAPQTAAPPTPEGTQSPALIDLSSTGWFDWLESPDGYWSLYVGRLDGRAFKVIDSGAPVFDGGLCAGPVHGMVLVSWQDADERRSIDLIDTADGTRTTIASSADVNLGCIDPTGTYVYWTTSDGGAITGLWRQPVSGGSAEKVLGGRKVPGSGIHFSLDGKYLAISGWNGEPGSMEATYDYAVFDAEFRLIAQLHESPYGDVVGFLDDRLVVYPHQSDDAPAFELFAFDIHDWSATRIAASDGYTAGIVPDRDGTPRLLFDGRDDKDRYTVSVLDPGGSPRVLFVGEAPWDEPPDSTVYPSTTRGVELPGWVAVFPRGRAITNAALADNDQGSRRLVRISDGQEVSAPPLSLQP